MSALWEDIRACEAVPRQPRTTIVRLPTLKVGLVLFAAAMLAELLREERP